MTYKKSTRILLVDDDAAYGEATARLLRREGYEVERVQDFGLALKRLEADEPLDLLLTDIVMPNSVNGVALSRMARLRRPDLKVLYMTAYDLPGLEDEVLGPILHKPVPDERLATEVKRLLGA